MKINKLFTLGTLLMSVLAFTACSDDDDWAGPGEESNGAYLYSDASSFSYIPTDTEAFTIHVGRTAGAATSAGSVSLSTDNSAFTVPSSVDFAAGETTKDVTVNFDIAIGSSASVKIAIPSDQASVYGNDTLSITVSRDYNWVAGGSGTFTDNTFFSAAQTTVTVQHADGTNIYRLVTPYKVLDADDFTSTSNIQFTLNEDGTVGFDDGIYDIFGYNSYEMYFDNGNYPSYCNVTNEDGTITWNFLILQGESLYTGGNFSFEWLDGYPLDE